MKKMFENLPIGRKIIAVLLLVIVLEVIIAVVGVYFLNNMNANLNEIVNVQAEKIKLGARINRNLVEIHRAEKNMILSDTKESVESNAASISGYKIEVVQRLAQLKELADAENRALLNQFEADYLAFIQVDDQVQAVVFGAWEAAPDATEHTRWTAAATALSQGPGRAAYDRAAASMATIVDSNDEELAQRKALSDQNAALAQTIMLVLAVASIAGGLAAGLLISRSIAAGLSNMVTVADAIAAGDLETVIAIKSQDEVGQLAAAVTKMQAALRQAGAATAAQDWLKTGIARLNDVMRGELDVATLSSGVLLEIATYLDAQIGALYLLQEGAGEPVLALLSSYAYTKRKNLSNRFRAGEGLVGQAALEKHQILVRNVPEDYIKVTSGLGEASPQFIAVTPFLYEDRVKGVIELGTLSPIPDLHLEYLAQAMPALAINLETAQGREQLAQALAASQALAEELQVQQAELEAANEELEEQTQMLEQSEARLKTQQEELQVTNEELEEKNEALQRQKREIELARREIEEQAEEVAIASKYKSEFLANMSHELRTPLNSLLLLARLLADNPEGNLTADQVEHAHIIYASGNDLLALITEILDLSKIEAGRMELQVAPVLLADLAESTRSSFQHMAEAKGLALSIAVGADAPATITTDRKRVEQILKNLVSNAIKFTDQGRVTVTLGRPARDAQLAKSGLQATAAIAIAVQDTGIGIPLDKQKIVFEAFQQVEGGSARKHGGTGLGLSISRELARLLGGEIQLQSAVDQGSTFTLYLPIEARVSEPAPAEPGARAATTTCGEALAPRLREPAAAWAAAHAIPDDRDNLAAGDKTILIIEDDANFAKLLLQQGQQKGFKCLAAATGESGLELAAQHRPTAIILDIRLPGMDGWAVLEALKDDPHTRHIPVHIMSVEEATLDAFRKGAVGHLTKPATREDLEAAFRRLEEVFGRAIKELLVVEDDDNLRRSIIRLVGNGDVHADEATSGAATIQALQAKRYDCLILDLGLPDMTGFQLLQILESREGVVIPPVIVYTGQELSREEEIELRRYAESIIIKGVRSEERLLDEVSLFLHRMVDRMPEQKRRMIADLHDTDLMFRGKTVLVVDDDMRNVFALSRVLETKGMRVLKAENGQKALSTLAQEPAIDLVIMDIMMPVMDGYETMQRIRAQERFRKLPIIALTAKAMQLDRERCLAAGASDYLAKPVDVNRLCSMMRVWLYR
ncbi:MAG: response regulator [Chloroflexi bacterium]|nr:response regulator [Chloroflexota bacterium]MBU1747430.1 response regulator [Chloroflexota bacterium]